VISCSLENCSLAPTTSWMWAAEPMGAPRAMMPWEGRRNSRGMGRPGESPALEYAAHFSSFTQRLSVDKPPCRCSKAAMARAGAPMATWVSSASDGSWIPERLPPWLTAGGDRIGQMQNPQKGPPDVTPYWTATALNPRYPV
jgi:hypothetical protein